VLPTETVTPAPDYEPVDAGLSGVHAAPSAAKWSEGMPIEFLQGRPLSPDELEMIRQQIESFDDIASLTTEYAASSLATGPTCYRSFRHQKTNEIQGWARS
jgi:hypothetical protein